MRKPRLMLPVHRWPEIDRAVWEVAMRTGDIFEDAGPAAHWSEGSKRTVCFGYRRWLGHLALTDPEALELSPRERVSPDIVAAYIELLQSSISPTGVYDYAKHLYDAIRVIAPEGNWRWLHAVARQLQRLVVPPNKRPRMVDAHRLSALGLELIDCAETSQDKRPSQKAVLYRDGLIIALLSARPMRRRNLAAMRIGTHLIRNGQGYAITFGASETKNRQPITSTVPDDLLPYLERYLDVYRPMIPGAKEHLGLWASMKGGPMTGEALYERICRHTKAAFGKPVNPHLFRDCVATTIAIEDPVNVQIAADLLGHSSLEFTSKYYIQAETVEAGCAFR